MMPTTLSPSNNITIAIPSILQVAKIIIFSDSKHSDTKPIDLLNQHLPQIQNRKIVNFISFNEQDVCETLHIHNFSLEEWSYDNDKSFAPSLRLATLKTAWEYIHEKYFSPLLIALYVEPYFKEILIQEKFKKYNPYKYGLSKKIAIPNFKMTSEKENALKLVQKEFTLLDFWVNKLPPNISKEAFLVAWMDRIHDIISFDKQTYDPSVFSWISEYAAVKKTIAICKIKNIKEKELGDFTLDALWKHFYKHDMDDDEYCKYVDKMRFENATHFMANKIERILKKYIKNVSVSLSTFSVVISTGSSHVPILLERLKKYSKQSIEVVATNEIAKYSLDQLEKTIMPNTKKRKLSEKSRSHRLNVFNSAATCGITHRKCCPLSKDKPSVQFYRFLPPKCPRHSTYA